MPSSDAPAGESWLESSQWLARARRLGPLRYSDLGPRRLGRPGDGPGEMEALATWIAAAVDGWWDAAGRPDPYTLVVVSGDDGHLARAVLGEGPACSRALRYVLVDPQQAGRTEPPPTMAALVPLEEPAFLYPAAAPPPPVPPGPPPAEPRASAPSGQAHPHPGTAPLTDPAVETDIEEFDLEFGERPPARGIGPLATFLTEIPALGESDGAVVAVRLLSRLPYDLFERRDGEWCEVRIAAAGGADATAGAGEAGRLVELTVPAGEGNTPPAADTTPAAPQATLPAADTTPAAPQTTPTPAPEIATPTPIPTAAPAPERRRRLTGATDWLRRILPTASAGVLAVIDQWAPPGDTETVDLAQLRHVREPQNPEPVAVAGTSLSVVTWRLG